MSLGLLWLSNGIATRFTAGQYGSFIKVPSSSRFAEPFTVRNYGSIPIRSVPRSRFQTAEGTDPLGTPIVQGE